MGDDSGCLLSTTEERASRAALLAGPAFAVLDAYGRDIAARFGPTPHIDPLDGGTDAQLLLLLETPGLRGASPRFVSRDNPTGTGRNLRRFLGAASIQRQQTVLWNTVPRVIHADGARNRPPRRAEVETGLSLLPGFVTLLPRLRVVVMAGRTAALAMPFLREVRPDLALFGMPHPSPTYVNTSPMVAALIAQVLAEAAACLAFASDSSHQAGPSP
jgi:uracil-DNA glycosylase